MSIEPNEVVDNIKKLTSKLIELSLCNEQNYPSSTTTGSVTNISFSGGGTFSLALKNTPYRDIYLSLIDERAYNFKMVDGALIQMSYYFRDGRLSKHRLAFFPSPDLTEFQNNPEIYEAEELYAEIIHKSVVPFPIRFDFDDSDNTHVELHHPRSHVTLGQYQNCRIPVTAPLGPFSFVDFILRSFYNTAHRKYCEELPVVDGFFDDTITENERAVIHFSVPGQ